MPTPATELASGPPPRPAGAASSIEALIGTVVAGRYKVLAKLGQGGMGTVFRAEQVSLKRVVALKVLDPSLFTMKDHVRRFHAEAETAARLSHPNTVTLYDFGETERGLLFIAMELIAGKSLRAVIADEGPIPVARALDICEQVASSIADAQSHGIVHRDLKPDNVMLSERGGRTDVVRVLDFGIAKLRDAEAGGQSAFAVTRVGDILGTPLYMSPEQVLGEKVDGRTDVYSLGIMLYEMLTQRLPFEAGTVAALLAMHIHTPPMPLAERRPGVHVPAPVADLIMRCLAKKRDGRPVHMEAVRAELAQLRAALGFATPMTPTTSPVQRQPEPEPAPAPAPVPVPVPVPAHATARPPSYTPVPPQHQPYTPMPMPMPAYTPPPGPVPGRSRWPLYLVLAAVLIGGGITAAILLTRGDKNASAGREGGDDGDDGSDGMGEGGEEGGEEGGGFQAPLASESRFQSAAFDYYLDVPPGFTMAEQNPLKASGFGLVNGVAGTVFIGVFVPNGGVKVTNEMLTQFAEQIVAGDMGVLVKKGTRNINGRQHVSLIYDVEALSMRIEMVAYIREGFLVGLSFGSPVATFDDTDAFRDELYERRFGFRARGGGGGAGGGGGGT